jgi:hypothetical protein
MSEQDFERRYYPLAPLDMQRLLHATRGIVRSFLQSDLGAVRMTPKKKQTKPKKTRRKEAA